MKNFVLAELPPDIDIETKVILKQAALARSSLGELKGVSQTIPHQEILISTLPLIEAKNSSAIENIITTQDELYKANLFGDFISSPAAKEVQNYSYALRAGYEKIVEIGLFSNNQILEIQKRIKNNSEGFRKVPGIKLKNKTTGDIIYTPPQNPDDIIRLMNNLERYINNDLLGSVDPLIKMAIIHYQFESIHPFSDGNGRTGRIINILYLVYKRLLDIPVLYLSHYIVKTKNDYYRLLQEVRIKNNWEEWILYMLKGVEETSRETIKIITKIRELMKDYKYRIKKKNSFYSQDLINNLFRHPYTKIEFIANDLQIHRQTAAKHLNTLVDDGFLELEKIANSHFYINRPLYQVFEKGWDQE